MNKYRKVAFTDHQARFFLEDTEVDMMREPNLNLPPASGTVCMNAQFPLDSLVWFQVMLLAFLVSVLDSIRLSDLHVIQTLAPNSRKSGQAL